jgi:hypothetical protein
MCVFRAFLAKNHEQALPCSVSETALGTLFVKYRSLLESRDFANWNLMGCAPTGEPGRSACIFEAPDPVPGTANRMRWMTASQADGRHLFAGAFLSD